MPRLPPFYRLPSILPPPSNLHGSKIKQIHFENAFTPIQRQKKCTIQSKSPIFPCIFVVCFYYQLTVTNTLQQQRQMLHSLCSQEQHLKFGQEPASTEGATTVAKAAKMVSPMTGVLPLPYHPAHPSLGRLFCFVGPLAW